MRNLGTIYGHIPARGGSKRVPAKNLRYLCGKPLIGYAIECALHSKVLDEVYVNTDSDAIAAVARAYGVKIYRRSADLGSDTATGDDFTADFIEKMKPDTLVMISPVCPLVTATDVQRCLEAFRASDCDTLITCQNTQMQTFCAGKAVNIDPEAPLAPSQENPVVQILNWAVTIWDTKVFLQGYAECKRGYLGRKRLLYPLDPTRSLKISHEADFRMAGQMIRAGMDANDAADEIRYWEPQDGIPLREARTAGQQGSSL